MKIISIFLISILIGPFLIITHELGHFIADIFLGIDSRLQYANVDGPDPCSSEFPLSTCLISVGAGPLTTLLMVGITTFLFYRTDKIVFFILGGGFSGRAIYNFYKTNTDELQIDNALRLPRYTTYIITLIISLILIFLLIKRLKEDKIKTTAIAIAGLLIGAFIWLFLLGPIILP